MANNNEVKRRRFGGFFCPECGGKLVLRSSERQTETMRKRFYLCNTVDCDVKSLSSNEELRVVRRVVGVNDRTAA